VEIDKYELARKYYSEDNNSLSDFVDYLDEYLKLTSDNSDSAKSDVRCAFCDDHEGMGYEYCGWCGNKF
jgi:hypothetical protein